MPLDIKSADSCRFDCISLGEVMLRLDPGDGRTHTTRQFSVWEGGGEYNVTRGLRRVKGTNTISDDLKTKASKRTIELPADLAEWLSDHRRAQAADHLSPLMFTSPAAGIVDPSRSRKDLARYCALAGVPKITPNELRHSCASLLSDMGVANELIADLLGHTTTRMVDETYRHRLRPVVDVAARADWTVPASQLPI
jgi:integrase